VQTGINLVSFDGLMIPCKYVIDDFTYHNFGALCEPRSFIRMERKTKTTQN